MPDRIVLTFRVLPWALPALIVGVILAASILWFPRRRWLLRDRCAFALMVLWLVVSAVTGLSSRGGHFDATAVSPGCHLRTWLPLSPSR